MSYLNHPNVKEAGAEEEGPVGEVQDPTEGWIETRILHILGIYPKLSNSMLQVGMGTSLPPKIWKPVLVRMINEGTLISSSVSSLTPDGRAQSYTVISVAQAK